MRCILHVSNSSPETRLKYKSWASEYLWVFKNLRFILNRCTDTKTDWHIRQQMDTKKKQNLKHQHCCQCCSPRYWVSVLSTRCGDCHPKGLIVASEYKIIIIATKRIYMAGALVLSRTLTLMPQPWFFAQIPNYFHMHSARF